MTPEGGALAGLLVGTAVLTGNLNSLVVGAVAGTAVGFYHYHYSKRDLATVLDDLETRLAGDNLIEAEKKHLEGLRKKIKDKLVTLKVASSLIAAATFLCPLGGAAYVVADRVWTERSRKQRKAYLDVVCA